MARGEWQILRQEVVDIIEEILVSAQIAIAKVKVAENLKEIDAAILESGLVDLKWEAGEVYAQVYPRSFLPGTAAPSKKRGRRGGRT
jgi:hypothetical protein